MSAPSTTADPEISKKALTRWRWAITAGFAVGGITVSAWGPRLPAIKTDLGISTGAIGLLLAGPTAGAFIGLLGSAWVLHLLGGRRAVAAAALLIAVSMSVLSLALVLSSVPLMAVAFVATGAGVGLIDVLVNVEGAEIERRMGRTALPMMHAAWSVGVAAGSGIGAACAALGITPAAQFLGEAVAIAAAAFGIAAFIPAGKREPDAPPARSRAGAVRQWLRGWLDWKLLLIGLVLLGCDLGEGAANSWLPLATRNDHGQSAAIAALFLTVFAVSEALTRVAASPVVDRIGRVRATQVTTGLGLIGIVAFILAGNPWLALAGMVLWAVGVSMGFPLGMSAAADSGPDPAARISVVGSIGYFANLAGPPVIGALAQGLGLLNAMWLIAALFLAAFAAAGSLRTGP